MLRSLPYILIGFMLLVGGMGAGGSGQADVFDKTYTPADWEEGGKLNDGSEPPEYLEFMGPGEEEESPLWMKQFLSAILNLFFAGTYAVARFCEQHQWVPWVFISQALTAGMIIGTVYAVAKAFRPELLADLIH